MSVVPNRVTNRRVRGCRDGRKQRGGKGEGGGRRTGEGGGRRRKAEGGRRRENRMEGEG
jgi:hypothetical protein